MAQQGNLIGQVIKDQYKIVKKVKSGGFGSVYIAKEINSKNRYVAIKLIDEKSKFYAQMQLKMYEKSKENNYTHGFIKHYDYGLQKNKYFLVLELLDKDLQEMLFKIKENVFSLKTVLMIGLQIIDRLEALHKIGYLHRDIKPDNIAIGFEQKNKIVYLIDFGLAKKIQEVRAAQLGKIIGSLGYMSCRAHQGKQTGTADDVQSLLYTMLYLLTGSLPWSRLKINTMAETHKILIMKRKISKSDFKKVIPEGLFQILNRMKNTQINQKVDYLKIKYEMINMLKNIKADNDFIFDWANIKSFSPSKRKISPQKLQKQKQKQQNQQQIQKQIYEVYKFIERPQHDKQQKEIGLHKKLNKVQNQKVLVNCNCENNKSIPKKEGQRKLQKNRQIKRPASTNHKRQQSLRNTKTALYKITQLYGQMKFQAPNIVINRTAKHNI